MLRQKNRKYEHEGESVVEIVEIYNTPFLNFFKYLSDQKL